MQVCAYTVYGCVCHFYLPVCLSVCLSACQFVCMSVCLSVCLYVCLPVSLSVCLSACLFICMSVCLSVCLHASVTHRPSSGSSGGGWWRLSLEARLSTDLGVSTTSKVCRRSSEEMLKEPGRSGGWGERKKKEMILTAKFAQSNWRSQQEIKAITYMVRQQLMLASSPGWG